MAFSMQIVAFKLAQSFLCSVPVPDKIFYCGLGFKILLLSSSHIGTISVHRSFQYAPHVLLTGF